jgi:hypothetical protein
VKAAQTKDGPKKLLGECKICSIDLLNAGNIEKMMLRKRDEDKAEIAE